MKKEKRVKCKIGLWFLSTVFPSNNIYVCTNIISIPIVLSKDMARIINHYLKKWLWVDNSVNILGRVMVLVFCPSSHCHLSINQISF